MLSFDEIEHRRQEMKQGSEHDFRQALIENIERYTGALLSVPYHKISTKDLEAISTAFMVKD